MAEAITRRRFLNHSATGIAALTAMPLALRCVHASSAPAPLRVAAIGVGNRGADNLIELQEENVVALCDVDARYLDAARRRFPDARPYDDYRRLLRNEEKLDAVVISTPDHSHALPALLAMRRGCHVFCEKPLAHNLHETRLLAQVAREQPVITQMANQHRASAGYHRARQLLEAGVLGQVQSCHAWTLRPLWPQGIPRPADSYEVPEYLNWDLWLGPAPSRPYHSAYHPIAWRGWCDFGTGALGDLGTHLLDPVLNGLKLGTPIRIEAETAEEVSETFPASSVIRFHFVSHDDARPMVLTWYDGGNQPPKEITGADRLPDDGALVIGERGTLFIPTLGKAPRLVPASSLNDAPSAAEVPASTGHIRQWITAIKRGQADICDTPFEAGARLTDVCLLGNLVLRAGKSMEWDANEFAPKNSPECLPLLTRHYRDGWGL